MYLNVLGKGCLIVLFPLFFLFSCFSSTIDQWHLEHTRTSNPCFQASRLILPCPLAGAGMEYEFLVTRSGMRMFINGFPVPFMYSEEDCEHTEVILSTEDSTLTVLADRLEGGQRLLIPPDAVQFVIDALLDCQTIHVSAAPYKGDIISCGFSEKFDQFYR